ncbi:MAG: 4-alpha-glucanotransferase [Elusimicrobia bacterium]|nr:4-alpha-glucanotransferase [Elusimicrobiota bacterium]
MSERACGLLLHVTSLPGGWGVGDLGAEARVFAEFLTAARQRWWQMLPVGPAREGDSPYTSSSTFAGSPLLISLEDLKEDGLLDSRDLKAAGAPRAADADYERARALRLPLLERAFAAFERAAGAAERRSLDAFGSTHAEWLDDYSLYAALQEEAGGAPWHEWDPKLRRRDPEALARAAERLSSRARFQRFLQHRFQAQWDALRARCRGLGIGLIGDLPIYVSHDSAEVWARPDLFELDAHGLPTSVAGVPPDYFSKTGQLWGNPLYRWAAHAQERFAWWTRRLKRQGERFDAVRLDHFIGFRRFWEIPASAKTAKEGRWRDGPGERLFDAALPAARPIEIIAEDLGASTPEVDALRRRFEFPGMRVLQFAFDGDPATNPHQPRHHERRGVVYTGTHDNDTSRGWYESLPDDARARVREQLGDREAEPSWALLRLAWSSVSDTAVAPAQDVLCLGTRARMNVPGAPAGNWRWRAEPGALDERVARRLAELTAEHRRAPSPRNAAAMDKNPSKG